MAMIEEGRQYVANTGWGSEEARVVCRKLGESGNTPSADLSSSVISAPRTFLLDEVVCNGDEGELLDCEHGTRGVHDCSSWRPEYAKVTCSSGEARGTQLGIPCSWARTYRIEKSGST